LKKLLTILLFLLLCNGLTQYRDYISYYETRIYRINDGYEVPHDKFKNEDDTLFYKISMDTVSPPFVSPYTSFLWSTDTTLNDSNFWEGDTMSLSTIVKYPIGSYEITVHEAIHWDSLWVNGVLVTDTTAIAHSVNALYLKVDSSDVPLSIFLTFFEAAVVNDDVSLTWITKSEVNNCGFNIYRNNKKINDNLIQGNGSTSVEHIYKFLDTDVIPGRTYTYSLESVLCDGTTNIEGSTTIFVPIINTFYLAQNYPNPFNNSTTIKFSIYEKAKISLIIYDITGKLVHTIIDGEITDPGNYQEIINADDLSSGNYFYILKVHSVRTREIGILSKKMTLIK
jgi:hypothetical protein